MMLHSAVYAGSAWFGIAVVGLSTILVWARGNWRGALVLLLFFTFSLGFVLFRRHLPNLFDLIFVFAAMINGTGYVWDLFTRVSWYDEAVHAFTTFAFTLAFGFLLFGQVTIGFRGRAWLFGIIVASLGMATGVVWEILEYGMQVSIDLADTIWDLIYDTGGAACAGVLAAIRLRKDSRRLSTEAAHTGRE